VISRKKTGKYRPDTALDPVSLNGRANSLRNDDGKLVCLTRKKVKGRRAIPDLLTG